MANPYIGWVNLQMVSVRHHLSLLVEENNANDRIRNRGVLESTAWHLRRAYQSYLCELGENYQLKSPEGNTTADELSAALESVGKHPGEAAELAKLEKEGWVADLMNALTASESFGSSVQDQGSASELQLMDLDRNLIPLTSENLNTWLSAFKELIARHRDMMVEY